MFVEKTCALCPTEDRCQPYWPTLESSWVHVVCALGIQGVLFYDELYYTPVDISNVSIQKFGNKVRQTNRKEKRCVAFLKFV